MPESSSPLDQTLSYNRIKGQDGCLRRFVALKFLAENVAHDPQALARFEPKAPGAFAFDQPMFRTPKAPRCPRDYAL
jgi:hypothetical protein